MNIINVLVVVCTLTGCTTLEFVDKCGNKLSRTGFSTDVHFDEMRITCKDVEVHIVGGSSEQVKALEAVARGAAQGMKGGM